MWNPLVGYSSPYLALSYITTDVTSGQTYSFKLRAQNIHGWSDWSQITTLLAASVPAKMTMVTVTDGVLSNVSAKIAFTVGDDSGSPITKYRVEI